MGCSVGAYGALKCALSKHDFTYEEWPGIHDWYFFNDALKKALEMWYA
ncbi:hypothetical protein FACS1894109_12080 [Spirochaetia bacterium]|nr:hypothetical protein FACS1894109_12080 [Spirochaetia bacterium]